MVAFSDAERRDVLNRLARIEGQVRGVQRMVEEDQYCVDILTQIAAITTALDRVGLKVLDSHVHGCVRDAMLSGGEEAAAKTEEMLEAVERFARMR
jgi:DNA-binding FrmR family transcriptional regulator